MEPTKENLKAGIASADIPDDVKAVIPDVLRHRILLTYEAEAENISTDLIVQKILQTITAP